MQTTKIEEVRKELLSIGDVTKQVFDNTKDLNAAKIAISAYSAAINSAKTQVMYKRLSGKPETISFLED